MIRHTRPCFAVETEILDPKTIAADDAANSGITNTTVVYDDRESPTPIFTINPTQPSSEGEPEPTSEA